MRYILVNLFKSDWEGVEEYQEKTWQSLKAD